MGDRYVLEAMKVSGYNLGGEQSGHVILSDHATTGDGILTTLHVMERMATTGKPLTEGGLRVGYLWNNGKYEVAGFVRNITDKVVVNGAIDFNNLTGFINDPRTYGVQFKALF